MIARPLIRNLAATSLLLVAGPCAVYAQSASEDRAIGHFSKLVVGNGIDVELTQSTEESLRLEVEGLELADIVVEIEDDTLTLSNPGSRNWFSGDREATAYISFVQLSAIDASGGSDIESRNDVRQEALSIQASGGSDIDLDVSTQSLEFTVSGGSDVEVSGETKALTIQASGGSDISAESLEAERVNATISGGSDASIRVSAAIVLDASSGSDVSIYGNPSERTVNNDRSSDLIWH